ncbi:High-affnity carbon uptake protein Hat/HatR [Imperialibacter roseus]|uniref:High-affnity carbon uptake protein Hat/HatR n=1 Tax=Imperialibacter roseus TaxID=1324217 RepID=A0ABZ0IWR2_9BACT|nr:High-affnity carbon uptake protein Hat/HatR [Imperialibacter roseus]WOK08829.1 High-affnity carbon uptake protein Hat/HatR [Imperialibacter roseus]
MSASNLTPNESDGRPEQVSTGAVTRGDTTTLFNPFPGLRPFGVEESHLFFGREGQSDEVLVKLAENRFSAVLGSSGSGKSSLMYCGLIPTLYGGFMTQAGSNWKIVVLRPGGGPIDNLAESLVEKDDEYAGLEEEERLIRKTITATVLRSSSLGLVEAVKQLKKSEDENILILVDQFEELFRYKKTESMTSSQDESSAFVNLLMEAVHQFDEPIYVTITMRSDFIGECAVFPELTQMINDSHYLIPQMTRDQKRLAIEGPVAVGGGTIAPRLVQQLLNDVGDNPDQLPILQHSLMRTWSFWADNHREAEAMDIRHYNAIGTLKEALSQHANEAYDMLSKREKQICETMFKALTERGSENQGIRRPTKLSVIASIAGVTEDEVYRVVDKFREPGRSLLMPPHGKQLESETVIDISHESLMRIWTRLKSWLDEESRSAEMYLKLSESAGRYQEGRAGLWKMPDLQLALNWQEENRPTLVWGQRYNTAYERTIVFLETSKRAYETEQRNKELLQKRQIRRSRIFALVLAGAALVCIFMMIYAFILAAEATKQTVIAEQQAELAQKNADEAQIQSEAAQKSAKEANDQREKAEIATTQAIEQKNEADQQRRNAEAATLLAEAARKDAVIAQDEAVKQAEIANEQKDLATAARVQADEARKNAEDLRYQAIAQSMAIKTAQVKDTTLKTLIAMQAFNFFREYSDKPYNGDIYEGLYNAWKGEEGENVVKWAGHTAGVRSVVFSKDGKIMYSAGADGRVLRWDMTNDKREGIDLLPRPNSSVNRVVAVSPDERYVAVGNDAPDNNIQLIDLRNPDSPKFLKGHNGIVNDLVFFPDASGFVSVGVDGSIKKSDFATFTSIATPGGKIEKIAISPDGKVLAAGSVDGSILLYELSNNNLLATLNVKTESPVTSLAFSGNGQYLAFGDLAGKITIQDIIAKKTLAELNGHESKVADLRFNNLNTLLASAGWDGTAKLWVMKDIFDLPITLRDHGKYVNSVSFSPDGHKLATASFDNFVRVWPTRPDEIADKLCPDVDRNMNQTEWNQYVGGDIEYEITCIDYPSGVENK